MKNLKAKNFILLGIILTFTLLLLAGCGGGKTESTDKTGAANNEPAKTEPAKEDAKPITLTLAHFFPATHDIEARVLKNFIADVEKATNGRVKITSYPAGTLTPSTETYDGVVKGVADMGISAYSYNRGRFPVVESFIVPGLNYNNSKSATYALNEGIKQLNPKELQDTHHLLSFATGPGSIYTTKKAVRTMADMKGLQLGATAGLRADAIGLLGGVPVVQPIPEWYESLSKGIMDGGVAPVESVQGFRTGEVSANYLTLAPFVYNQALYLVMNNDKWNSLPADIQQALTEVSNKYIEGEFGSFFDDIDIKGMKWLTEKKKVEIISLSDEETAKWVEKLKPLEDKYIKTLNDASLPGADIMKTVKELAEKGNAKFPEKDVFVLK
ncbi:MAG: TRAP transporter substrate-binding protein [Thermincola sp.]|nr:TRAP transporter substrate-binding protein [Thermincola sp.]MDT3701820.1 TRAP transporter substrate-binding protein [Thermincola sp.]